jgi:osmotically-inducible protein OsmY
VIQPAKASETGRRTENSQPSQQEFFTSAEQIAEWKVTAAAARRACSHPPRNNHLPIHDSRSKAMATAESALDTLITSTIQKNPYLKSRNLRFETQDGRVVVRGIVHSYYHKQMAQEALRRLDGVDRVENHLEVNWL